MIISRTPLRVSFVGGGSDLPSFYRMYGGAVLSMSIKKYVYLSMHNYFERDGYILKYSSIETPRKVEEIQHRIIRQVFKDMVICGVDFNSSADVPAGTGMGSSSAFTVGLLNLAYLGKYVGRGQLAEMACDVELNKLGEPIGKQDQYGCALGGVNLIRFNPDDSVSYAALPLRQDQKRQLEANLVMFYLGGTRSASRLLAEQSQKSASDKEVIENLKAMTQQAEELYGDLCVDVDVLGAYLHEGWERKRSLTSGISNPMIDEAYVRARKAGATGGKLLGAGGAGFLLLYTPNGTKPAVIEAMKDFSAYQVLLDNSGSKIIYND